MSKISSPSKGLSPNRRAWQRLLRNRPAIFGLIFILFTLGVALFGYVLAPDSSPNANTQTSQLGLSPPGFRIQMLKVRKNQLLPSQNFLYQAWYGQTNPYHLVPIQTSENNTASPYQFYKDSIQVSVYQGKDLPTQQVVYHLADVVYPLPLNVKIGKVTDLQFESLSGEKIEVSLAELQRRIEKDYLYTHRYWLGTDYYGRCLLSRLLLGVRISLSVGLVAVLISLSIGVFMGALAGYVGGRTDDFIMLIINTMWSIPTLLLVFALVLALGRGFWQIFTAVGLTMWVEVARVVRGQVLSLKEIQFVEAAESLGYSRSRIILRHILPNIIGPVMVIAAANFAMAILIEAGLSYLGFGIQPPQPSWGNMLSENYSFLLLGNNPFPALAPGLAIMAMVLAFNLVGNGLRDALDVR